MGHRLSKFCSAPPSPSRSGSAHVGEHVSEHISEHVSEHVCERSPLFGTIVWIDACSVCGQTCCQVKHGETRGCGVTCSRLHCGRRLHIRCGRASYTGCGPAQAQAQADPPNHPLLCTHCSQRCAVCTEQSATTMYTSSWKRCGICQRTSAVRHRFLWCNLCERSVCLLCHRNTNVHPRFCVVAVLFGALEPTLGVHLCSLLCAYCLDTDFVTPFRKRNRNPNVVVLPPPGQRS